MAKPTEWSWPVFFDEFWRGFGPMMAAFAVMFVLLSIFADTSYANFESAAGGLAFALVVSVVYGYSRGEDAVSRWRERDPSVGKTPNDVRR